AAGWGRGLRGLQGGDSGPGGIAGQGASGRGRHGERDRAERHRYRDESRGHAEGGFFQMGESRIHRGAAGVPPVGRGVRDHGNAHADRREELMARTPRIPKGPRIAPEPVTAGMTVDRLVDGAFLAYNGARLREACRLFVERILEPDVTVGLTLSG